MQDQIRQIKGIPPGNSSNESPPISGVDRLFSEQTRRTEDFQFDANTASVFDDMVSRSVPMYHEYQRMIGELSCDFAVPGTRLYDLGCSTGTTLSLLDGVLSPDIEFVGIDNSVEMLSRARGKLASCISQRKMTLEPRDLAHDRVVNNASVVIMNLTLQFVRPMNRERTLQWIFEGLNDHGCLLLVEKQTSSSSLLNRLYIEHYYAFKRRNGYSEIEISKKREALENVLIPYRPEENRELLEHIGFRHVEEFGRWYNFAGIIAIKAAV